MKKLIDIDDERSDLSMEECDPLDEILYFLKTLGKSLVKHQVLD